MTSLSKDEPLSATPETPDAPSGIDRRAFLMRNAAIGAAAVTGDMEPRGPRAAGRDGGWRSASRQGGRGRRSGLKMSSASRPISTSSRHRRDRS